jgi:hypothetical protein
VNLPSKPPAPALPVREGDFRHDGFYFRFSTGLGGYIETLGMDSGPVAARASGISGTIELGTGGTVAPGWVLGLGIFLQRPLATSLELSDAGGEALPKQVEPSFRDGLLLGPLVDWYPNARKGLHFQGALGFVHFSRPFYIPGDFGSRSYGASGAGAMIGLGQEWWTSEQDSIGVTTQFFLSTAWGRADENTWRHWQLGTPTFVFTWTHH